MKITLISSSGFSEKQVSEEWKSVPMNLLYLGSYLNQQGHDVTLLDHQVCDVKKLIDVAGSDMVGLSVMTSQVKQSLEISKLIREQDGDIPIVWGGIHPSLLPEQTIKSSLVDYVIVGEGERSLHELSKALEGKIGFKDVPGLVWSENGSVRRNNTAPYMDMNMLSPPDWSLIDAEQYAPVIDFNGEKRKYFSIHSGRGCVYNCAFCINTVIDRKWRKVSAEKVMNEVKHVYDKFGIRYVFFFDENFFIDRERAVKIANGIVDEKLDLNWETTCRSDYLKPSYLGDDKLHLFKKAGLSALGFGMESGSQRILDMIHKGIKVEDSVNAVKVCKKYDIRPTCSFIIGLPTETMVDLNKTLDLINKLINIAKPMEIMLSGPQVFRPYPGSELYDKALSMGLKEPKSLDEWSELSPDTGFLDPSSLPWLENPELLKLIEYYAMLSIDKPKNFVYTVLNKAARFRMKNHFFKFPVEKRIAEVIGKIRN